MTSLVNNTILTAIPYAWGLTKQFFKSLEPYQPMVATISILSKAAYKLRFSNANANKISGLKVHLRRVRALQKSGKTDLSSLYENRKYLLDKAKTDQLHIHFALMQLISLAFSHPGSNIWNTLVTLLGRFFSVCHSFAHIKADPSNKINGILGVFSSLGSGAALLKQTGAILEYTPLLHGVLGASFISMAIESVLMLKNHGLM